MPVSVSLTGDVALASIDHYRDNEKSRIRAVPRSRNISPDICLQLFLGCESADSQV